MKGFAFVSMTTGHFQHEQLVGASAPPGKKHNMTTSRKEKFSQRKALIGLTISTKCSQWLIATVCCIKGSISTLSSWCWCDEAHTSCRRPVQTNSHVLDQNSKRRQRTVQ